MYQQRLTGRLPLLGAAGYGYYGLKHGQHLSFLIDGQGDPLQHPLVMNSLATQRRGVLVDEAALARYHLNVGDSVKLTLRTPEATAADHSIRYPLGHRADRGATGMGSRLGAVHHHRAGRDRGHQLGPLCLSSLLAVLPDCV